MLSFSLAGAPTEVMGDIGYRIPPLTDVDVVDLVDSVKAAPLLRGHAGAAPVDTQALYDVIARLSVMADQARGGIAAPQPAQHPCGRRGGARRNRPSRPCRHPHGLRPALDDQSVTMVPMRTPRRRALSALPHNLTEDIAHAGYYPALVSDVVASTLGEEPVASHLVHAETMLDNESVHRHITVLALTATRLIIVHADDHSGGELEEQPTEPDRCACRGFCRDRDQ